MQVIGFFGDLFNQFGALMNFVTTSISDLYGAPVALIGDWSIIQLLGVGLGGLLITTLVLHLVHLVNPIG